MLAQVFETFPSQENFSERNFKPFLIGVPSPSESLDYESQLDSIKSWSSSEDQMFPSDLHVNYPESESHSSLQPDSGLSDAEVSSQKHYSSSASVMTAPESLPLPHATCKERSFSVINNHVGGSKVLSASLSSDAPPTVTSQYQQIVDKNKALNVEGLQFEAGRTGLNRFLKSEAKNCEKNKEINFLSLSKKPVFKLQNNTISNEESVCSGLPNLNNGRHFDKVSENIKHSILEKKYSTYRQESKIQGRF